MPDATIPELFAQQAARTPDAVALVCEDASLSYRELDARANQLAHHLRALGAGPETIVALCVERSFDMVIALIGILKAGAAYLPLDPDYPNERLHIMMAQARPRVLLTHSSLIGKVANDDARTLILLDRLDTSGQPTTAPSVDLNSEHPAYLIFTSGSTGEPKGAANTHGGLHNRLAWMQDTYRLTPDDAVLQKTPFSFDVSVWEFFWPLITGARLVIAAPGAHRDPAKLVETIRKQNVTTLHFVPSMLQAFLAYGEAHLCSSVRHLICSGEALSPEIPRQVAKLLPNAQLENLYGPTEAAIDVTRWSCGSDAEIDVPIGRPIWNTRAYVLDGDLAACSCGRER